MLRDFTQQYDSLEVMFNEVQGMVARNTTAGGVINRAESIFQGTFNVVKKAINVGMIARVPALWFLNYAGDRFLFLQNALRDMVKTPAYRQTAKDTWRWFKDIALRSKYPEAVLIYLTALETELLSRLQARGADDVDALRLRVAMARREMDQLPVFDYIVENADGKLDEAIDAIIAIVQAEHHRVNHRVVKI